jgi:hypothetical protein
MVTPTDSIRKKLYNLWAYNPYLTPKKACEQLQLDYKRHGNYVKKLLSEFRGYYSFGSPQKAQNLPEHRVFEWELVPRSVEFTKELFDAGWRVVANRNGMWVFRDARGSVHWYKEGLVRLYLRGELQFAKGKELFCRAFYWFGPEEFKKYLDVPLKEVYKKWIFELGSPVPRFDIRQFERSHGLRIFSDGSHPTSIHVGESLPFWIDEQRQATREFGEVVKQFGVEIQEHLKLIQEWQKEAKTSRIGMYVPRRKQRIKTTQPPVQRNLLGWMLGGEAKT